MLEEQYNPEQIESSIQSEWENTNKYKTAPDLSLIHISEPTRP